MVRVPQQSSNDQLPYNKNSGSANLKYNFGNTLKMSILYLLVLKSRSASGKPPQSYHMIAVITVKIYPSVNPFFGCTTQWFQIIMEFVKTSLLKKKFYEKVTMLFPDLTWLNSKMHCLNYLGFPYTIWFYIWYFMQDISRFTWRISIRRHIQESKFTYKGI